MSILTVALILLGCNKEEQTDTIEIQSSISSKSVLDNVPIIANPYKIENYLINKYDPDDEKMDKYKLDIGIEIRKLCRDHSFNCKLIEAAALSYNSSVNLYKLVSTFNLKSSDLSFKELLTILENADLTHLSQNPLKKGVIEEYIAAIYIPNIATCDMNKQPIICPGFEINCELPNMENFEGYIVGWFYDDDGKIIEIMLNEETAMKTTHPVFIIDNAEVDITARKKSERIDFALSSRLKSTMTTTEYSTNEYKINYRYEDSGNSEFCITAALIDENGDAYNILWDGNVTMWKEIASVNKDDIGDQLHHWEQFCSKEVLPYDQNFAFWNTYERDWYSSDKSLGTATVNGTTIYLSGNRVYYSEWYGIDPNLIAWYPVDFEYIYEHWAKWNENSKGNLRFWRVEL